MKIPLTILSLIIFLQTQGQVNCQYYNTNERIENAVSFYKKYLSEFKNRNTPDYSKYWSKQDCAKYKTPDPIVYSISSEVPTYSFITQKTIFYTKIESNVVQLKTLFATVDSLDDITIFAITNHYIELDKNGVAINFISPLKVDSSLYTTTQNQNITYHYPKTIKFNKLNSDKLLVQIRKFEKEWGFKPLNFEYYFAESKIGLAAMRGLDYVLGMEEETPSGIASPEDMLIYCSGNGEGYLHEVLHLYLNPLYVQSPVNHGLIYFLGGSIGYDFDELINKTNAYLLLYPATNLSKFETLETKDNTLNIYNIINGLLCKIIYEKEGVAGLKRILEYKTLNDLFSKEFKIEKEDWDIFLKKEFKKYRTDDK